MSLSPKDPAEIITVTFDFSALADAVSSPLITCTTIAGRVDASVQAMLSGDPQITDKKVLQRIIGGLDGNTYKIRCQANDADGERWVLSGELVVATA